MYARPVEVFRNARSQLGAIRAVVQTREEFDHLWEAMRRAGFGIDISSVQDSARILEVTLELGIATVSCNKEGYAAIEHPAVMVRVPRSQSTAAFRERLHRSC